MSAFICDPAHFAVLAAFAVSDANQSHAIYEWREHGDPRAAAIRVAQELARENIRSVAHRYGRADDELPGPCMPAQEIIDRAGELAERYFFGSSTLKPVDILKMCACYEYQACETDDWRNTLACRQIEWIRDAAMRQLDGWDEAPWDYCPAEDEQAA